MLLTVKSQNSGYDIDMSRHNPHTHQEEKLSDESYFFFESDDESLVPTESNSNYMNVMNKSSSMVNLNGEGHVISNDVLIPSLKKSLSHSVLLKNDINKRKNLSRNVSFSSLEVREYEITLGDHPSVSVGPPISLSWKYNKETSFDIEAFEAGRQPRRSRSDLILDIRKRRQILKEGAGFSASEIKHATMEVLRIKKNRSQSTSKIHEIEESFASAMRKFKSIRNFRNIRL